MGDEATDATSCAPQEGTEARHREQSLTVDERFARILEGLRTSLPGVQVLVAFLLTMPLQSGFAELGGATRSVYFIAFGSALVASILLIAPSVHQRVRAPLTGVQRHSERHLTSAVRTTIAGTVFMGVAFVAAAILVADLVTGTAAAVAAGAVTAATTGWFWFAQPILWALRDDPVVRGLTGTDVRGRRP